MLFLICAPYFILCSPIPTPSKWEPLVGVIRSRPESSGVVRSRLELSGVNRSCSDSPGVVRSRPESLGVIRNRSESSEIGWSQSRPESAFETEACIRSARAK
ncbi:uncharacterized protein LOC121601471 [Anopheles merus]|uniref:uncharacterized protein LOC121601471 n=1 Tax=Anopheles merus TaxID=30066 RepID=UPI001BE4A98F|nr:uncharacterized protein LOC121601471 [Anopheles merus]